MQLLTQRDVAELFGVSIRTVQRWPLKPTLLPSSRPGGRPMVRYGSDEIERFRESMNRPKGKGRAA